MINSIMYYFIKDTPIFPRDFWHNILLNDIKCMYYALIEDMEGKIKDLENDKRVKRVFQA